MWESVVSDWSTASITRRDEIEHGVRKGIPNSVRGKAWYVLSGAHEAKAASQFSYPDQLADILALHARRTTQQDARAMILRERATRYVVDGSMDNAEPELVEDGELPTALSMNQITLDIDRTFYSHASYQGPDRVAQGHLFNMLAVFARYNAEVGYCQGMAFVAGVLLMHMHEEDAFWAFATLLHKKQYLWHFYTPQLTRVQVRV